MSQLSGIDYIFTVSNN